MQPKKQKNIAYTPFNDKVGTVHVNAQNVEKITASLVPAKALRNKGGKRKRDDGSKSEEGPAHKKERKERKEKI